MHLKAEFDIIKSALFKSRLKCGKKQLSGLLFHCYYLQLQFFLNVYF